MTVLYVDIEHDAVVLDADAGPPHRAKVEVARSRLEAAAGESCAVRRFGEISRSGLEEQKPWALVLSGCTTDWKDYNLEQFEGLFEVIREARVPILGICGGHQLIGRAHGASWGPLGSLRQGEPDPDARFVPGDRKERGFLPLNVDPESPLFEGLGSIPCFFQSHYWQLLDVPEGFVQRARSPWSPIQAIERLDRPVFGVQFHPERFNADNPDGKLLLRNFFALSAN